MSEEQAKEQVNPLTLILFTGIASLVAKQKEALDAGKSPLDITDQEAFIAFGEGVKSAIKEINYGLYALSPQQEKFLHVIEQAKKDIRDSGKEDELELKLVSVPKRGSNVILDATGRPAVKDGLITLK